MLICASIEGRDWKKLAAKLQLNEVRRSHSISVPADLRSVFKQSHARHNLVHLTTESFLSGSGLTGCPWLSSFAGKDGIGS